MTLGKTTQFGIYELSCCGSRLFRVIREDGELVAGCHQLDFDTREDAERCAIAEVRRMMNAEVRFYGLYIGSNGWERRQPAELVAYPEDHSRCPQCNGPANEEKTMATKIEMAVQCRHGAWELIGEYSSFDRARLDAMSLVHNGHEFFVDDDNGIVFGLTEDPAGGHYEVRLWVDADTPSENTFMWVDDVTA